MARRVVAYGVEACGGGVEVAQQRRGSQASGRLIAKLLQLYHCLCQKDDWAEGPKPYPNPFSIEPF
jgi:hypothetical protein